MQPIEYCITGHPGVTIKLCPELRYSGKTKDVSMPAYWYCCKPLELDDPRHSGSPDIEVLYLTTEGWRDYGPIHFPTARHAFHHFLEFIRNTTSQRPADTASHIEE